MLCENALALGCERSNIFCLHISVYHNNRSDQVANKDRQYCTTREHCCCWFEFHSGQMVTPTFEQPSDIVRIVTFQTFVTFWRQTDRQSRRQCKRRKWRHPRRWRPSTPSKPSTVTSDKFYAVDGRQSSKVLRGVELVLKVSFDLPVKPLAAIHANFV